MVTNPPSSSGKSTDSAKQAVQADAVTAKQEAHTQVPSAGEAILASDLTALSGFGIPPLIHQIGVEAAPVIIGEHNGNPVEIDLEVLQGTRLLIHAASGGGKSHALRRLLEQTHPHIQQIIIDPENELVTLREQYEYLIIAPDGGDVELRHGSAGAVATQVFNSGASAIFAINDLGIDDARDAVEQIIRALLEVPREKWHPCMLVIDEAQVFAPQGEKASSKRAMSDLAMRARKRGLVPVCATPRLAALNKDVVASMVNKMIGLTTLPLDISRAADELGIREKDAQALAGLKPGEFMAFGPAISRQPILVRVGPVVTSHGMDLSLNKRVQTTMSRHELVQHLTSVAAESSSVESDFPSPARRSGDAGPSDAELIFAAIEPIVQASDAPKRKKSAEGEGADDAELANLNTSLKDVLAEQARLIGVGQSTLWRWKGLYDPDKGLSSLRMGRSLNAGLRKALIRYVKERKASDNQQNNDD